MRRVHWTIDLLDAHTVADFLRAHDLRAWVFDAEIVRQDWMHALAYGGFRVMVADVDQTAAATLIAQWRNNEFACAPADADDAQCPRCGSLSSQSDPLMRRWGFLALFLFPPALPFIPFRSRYRCLNCANRWNALRSPYPVLSASVEAAETGA